MRVLILGSGGREHALAWKVSTSKLCDKIYIAPGNAGTESIGENLNMGVNEFERIAATVKEKNIDLIIVGPEDPLVNGIRDYLENQKVDVKIVGPGKSGAQLEGSKEYSKFFMEKHNIPTASYGSFSKETLQEGKQFLKSLNPPYVLKADGLAAGKGVIITENLDEAEETLDKMLNGMFGDASSKVVIEEFLKGIEVSVFVVTDGEDYVILPEAKDYKRIRENDEGPNTGGMGAVTPVPFATQEFMQKVEERIILKTLEGLKKEGIDYRGFIFLGLMNVDGEPFVIEYNVRMGDPETQAVLTRVQNDFLEIMEKTADKKLKGTTSEISDDFACTVVMASEGYPGSYQKGKVINGIEKVTGSNVFHAGIEKKDGSLVTAGGRVLAVTSNAKDLKSAIEQSYDSVGKIKWDGFVFRKDIGTDILNY